MSDQESERALFSAIERGDLPLLRQLLEAGVDPDATMADWPHYRALQAAIEALEEHGTIGAIELLLKHGAQVNAWDSKRDSTALLMAVFRGQREAARLLLKAGADVNVTGSEGDSPLRWAASEGDIEMAKLLLEHGAASHIDAAGGIMGWTALGAAATRLDPEMVQLLLAAGASRDARDDDHQTALERVPSMLPENSDMRQRWERVRGLLASPGNLAG